jgi:hypothetical protein
VKRHSGVIREGATDIYFMAAPRGAALRGSIGFRATGRVELFDPLTGQIQPAPVTRTEGSKSKDKRTFVALDLTQSGSVFVVFRLGSSAANITRVERDGKPMWDTTLPLQTHTGLRVIKALYGDAADPARQWDVTEKARAQVVGGATTLIGHNDWAGGDPALRTVKTLIVTLQTPSGTQILQAREGQELTLPQVLPDTLPCEVLPGGKLLAWQNGSYRVTSSKGKTRDVAVNGARALSLSGPWTLHFPPAWDTPPTISLSRLKAWSELDNPAARAFSGTATYESNVLLEKPTANRRFVLDLGRVANIAEVTVNGRRAGVLWCAPYRLDVTHLLVPGTNRITIAVTNTWHNRLAFDAALPEAQRKTWTIAGPPAGSPLDPAGLLDTVKLRVGIVMP